MKKRALLNKAKEKYKGMDDIAKISLLDKKKRVHNVQKGKKKVASNKRHNSLETCLSTFNRKIREGPFYTCTVCNRLLYKRTVKWFVQVKYTSLPELFTGVKSYDGNEYICITCDKNVIKGKIPCQAVCNKMLVDEIPPERACLEKLESVLIAQRLTFEKLIILPKGQMRKIRGAVVNVPINHETVCTTLPRPSSDSGIIMVKLKRKLQYKGHQYFQAVRPSYVVAGLQWLQSNNPLYHQVTMSIILRVLVKWSTVNLQKMRVVKHKIMAYQTVCQVDQILLWMLMILRILKKILMRLKIL